MNENKEKPVFIYESFKNYITKKLESNEMAISEILKKGETIVDTFKVTAESGRKEHRNFLMVGKVQSGKTMNFISVMANAILKGVKFFIVLTAVDNVLNKQTIDRINESLDIEQNKNFLKLSTVSQINQDSDLLSEIIRDLSNDNIHIITSLKNNSLEKFTAKLMKNDFLLRQELIIIDDEGDAASMSHTKNKNSQTNVNIDRLVSNTNSWYLSVTGTPQVHILSKRDQPLYPHMVFCIEPGDKYEGLEVFTTGVRKHVVILPENIDEDGWYRTREFKEALLYYILNAANFLRKGVFSIKSHSNMLIHTDKKIDTHAIYKQNVDGLVDQYLTAIDGNTDDLSYINFINEMEKINNKYDLKIDLKRKETIDSLKITLKNLKVNEINSKAKPEINNNFCSIVIGSALVGRGLTLDNLIVTFFTNRAKGSTAIDTLLQRARWFGYRENISNIMKIYTTEIILSNFICIAKEEETNWKRFKEAEREGFTFDNINKEISISESEQLHPTGKTPYKKFSGESNIYWGKDILEYKENYNNFSKVIDELKNSKRDFIASESDESKYRYKKIALDSFQSLFKLVNKDVFLRCTNIEPKEFNSILAKFNDRKTNIQLVLVEGFDNSGYRLRKCELVEGRMKLQNIFQGRNPDSNNNRYVGDEYWNELSGYKDSIFVQIHQIQPTFNGKVIDPQYIYACALILPKNNETNKNVIFTNE